MANRIDTVMDAIETKLKTLVAADGTGVFKAVERAVINPLTANNPPVISLVISRLYREGATWTADVLVMIMADKTSATPDQRVTELVANADGAISALIDAATAGGVIDRPVWDFWYAAGSSNPQSLVGAIGGLTIRVEDPLLSA